MYYFNFCYIGLADYTDTGLVYSPFIDQYLNYTDWLKKGLLHTSNFFTNALGLNTSVEGMRKILIPGKPSLILGMPCVGINMLIFWTAFVNAHTHKWKINILWTIGAILAICLINCFRIVLIAFAIANEWNINGFVSHHDLFKYVAYFLIFIMMVFYIRQYSFKNLIEQSAAKTTKK